jgi:hypothetical protein
LYKQAAIDVSLLSPSPSRRDSTMNRVRLSVVFLVTLLAMAAWSRADSTGVLDASVMKIALHTSTEQEDGFIEHVIAQVNKGALPLDLVQSTFLWAKKKPNRKFFYFKQGLILRAADRGIKV